MLDQTKCQTLYLNLLDCHRKRKNPELHLSTFQMPILRHSRNISASTYVREFDETYRCDEFFDFSKDRLDLKNKMNKKDANLYDRVINFEETFDDEKIAAQACIHYNKWHQTQLVRSLTLLNWVYFQTIERTERAIEKLGERLK